MKFYDRTERPNLLGWKYSTVHSSTGITSVQLYFRSKVHSPFASLEVAVISAGGKSILLVIKIFWQFFIENTTVIKITKFVVNETFHSLIN